MILFSNIPKSKGKRDEKKRPSAIHVALGQKAANLKKEAILRIIQHPKLQGLPFILETPNEDEGYKEEIAFVKANMI